ncbi:nuclear transport factor 2 family protein [Actinoplanes sp. NPDC051851]|uniref:nuclear transport factor 2 family protein n=1 Tax=Actinoplanes sp. NPDC051851 TaxID=3154753 RepID=UPI003417738D
MQDRVPVEELLSTAELQVGAGRTAWRHVHAEYVDVVDDILATLAPSGPYAYTISPRLEEGRQVPTQRIVTTYDEIAATYRDMHRFAAVVEIRPMTEIGGSWYTFISGVGRGRDKNTGAESERPTIVLFPTMGSGGITGELFWGRTRRDTMPGDPAEGPLAARFAVGRVQQRLIGALREGDVPAAVALAHPEIQTGLRDYVRETGTLAALHTADGLREHLAAFTGRFEVLSLDVVQRHTDDWFFFHELRWRVRDRETGAVRVHHTAEYGEVDADGRIVAYIGHGTDQAAASSSRSSRYPSGS